MKYELFPPVREIEYLQGDCILEGIKGSAKSDGAQGLTACLPKRLQTFEQERQGGYWYKVGKNISCPEVSQTQGYAIAVEPEGITVLAADRLGLRYALDTLGQLISGSDGKTLRCLQITDWPQLQNRGLMLDVSRGKVYTRDYLLGLAELLSKFRYNVLQLYMEHSFDFKKHPEISKGSGPLTAEDILALKAKCSDLDIELQANLQSLGHFRRILTQPEYMELSESEMFWSLSTTNEGSLLLLDELYSEYLPLFDSPWLNVCLDEPYDLGRGQSADAGKGPGELYLDYLLALHRLAAKYGKRLMLFGDVFLHYPQLLDRVPKDVIFIDWIYDPKPHYETPAVYGKSGIPFWVSPGTSSWNTLFPRVDAAYINIKNLTLEGIKQGAQGILLTDWNDHGGYAQPGPNYYVYSYAALLSWSGRDPGKDKAGSFTDRALKLPGYSAVILKLAEIYLIPPIWSKNRSECVMALFDEPIFGGALRGPEPPQGFIPNDLSLPQGVEMVYERHSQHPLRPYFSIPPSACSRIRQIVNAARPMTLQLKAGLVREQLLYILDAFDLMLDKLDLSRRVIKGVGDEAETAALISFEDELRIMMARFVRLQFSYAQNWLAVAKFSEMDISMVYFAQIIARLDYLRDWLSIQREKQSLGEEIDTEFVSYQTGGYVTLSTY